MEQEEITYQEMIDAFKPLVWNELELGPVPGDEYPQQVGMPSYSRDQAIKECTAYKNQLERQFPIPDGLNCYYSTKGHGHDFGRYYEVQVNFDEETEAAVTFAFNVENNSPRVWDEAARLELGI